MLRKRIFVIIPSALLAFFVTTGAHAATTIDSTQAPTGTHLQTGSIGCSVSGTTVTCSAYELGGVGNTNARADLSAAYTATVKCRNHGGQIVEVKTQQTSANASTGTLRSKNGRLDVPELSSVLPTDSQFTANATCPNGNWTKELVAGSQQLVGFTYTLTFVGFSSPYITIT